MTCNRSMQRHPAAMRLKITCYLRRMHAAVVPVGSTQPATISLTVQQLRRNRSQCPSSPATSPIQLQRHPTALGEDAETVLEGQLLPYPSSYSQVAPHVPDKNHSLASGCSQRSCINIVIFLILVSFGFTTSWQRLPEADSSSY